MGWLEMPEKETTTEKPFGRFEFDTPDRERKFKFCLSKTPLLCKIYETDEAKIIAVRPKEFSRFRKVLADNGLGNCETSAEILKAIEWMPTEFIRFFNPTSEHKSRKSTTNI